MVRALLAPLERTAAAVLGGRGSGTSGDVANLRWVGVAFLGAAALCFTGFAVASLQGAGARLASLRTMFAILAAVFFLVGVGLAVAGVVAG